MLMVLGLLTGGGHAITVRSLTIASLEAFASISHHHHRLFRRKKAAQWVFDLVFVSANALLHFGPSPVSKRLILEVVSLQRSDGSWAGAGNLRVMKHDAKDPWICPEGKLYFDNGHLITTASAIKVLTDFASQWTAVL
jgi:hypothetical protein